MKLDIDALTYGVAGKPGFNRHRRTTGGSKERIVDAPNDAMREIHQRLIPQLRAQRVPNRYETAKPGSSIIQNVQPHLGHRFVVAYDLHNAFPRVRGDWLISQFATGDGQMCLLDELSNAEVIDFLRRHCLLPSGNGLRTGAPASPELFNLYAQWMLDFQLANLCLRYGITYTRYMDDLTFSSDEVIGKRKRARIRQIIWDAGFCITRSKAEVVDLWQRDPTTNRYRTVTITGICIDRNGRMSLPGPILRKIERRLHRGIQGRLSPAQVEGSMGYFRCIYPLGTDLTRRERRIEDLYRRYLGLPAQRKRIHFRTGSTRPEMVRR